MFNSAAFYEFLSAQEERFNYDTVNKFLPWLVYRDYPVLRYNEYIFNNKTFGVLKNDLRIPNFKWSIYTRLITKTSLYDKIKSCDGEWLTPQHPYVHVFLNDQDDWAMVNILHGGYYRVNYEPASWRKFAHFLNSKFGEYKNISVINRAKIIDDAFHFMIRGKLDFSIFWDLAKYLSQETDYVAWYPMIKVFEYMSNIFPFLSSIMPFLEQVINAINDIKENMKKLLDASLQILGYEEHPMENILTKCLRQEITKWACTVGSSECLNMATHKLEQHIKHPVRNKIMPGWKEWTYCKGLIMANASIWHKLVNVLLKKPDHELLPYLACSQNRSIITEHLPYIMDFYMLWIRFTQNKTDVMVIRSRINIFHSIIAKHANNYGILEIILSNFERIKPKEISTIVALIDIINHVYNLEHFFEIRDANKRYKFLDVSKVEKKIDIRLSQLQQQIATFLLFSNVSKLNNLT